VIIVFDLHTPYTLEFIERYMEREKHRIHFGEAPGQWKPIVIVGNKLDLKREVQKEGIEMAKKYNFFFLSYYLFTKYSSKV